MNDELFNQLVESAQEGSAIFRLRRQLAEAEAAWWNRMSNGDIAAELSATFDMGLPLAFGIAKWMLGERLSEPPEASSAEAQPKPSTAQEELEQAHLSANEANKDAGMYLWECGRLQEEIKELEADLKSAEAEIAENRLEIAAGDERIRWEEGISEKWRSRALYAAKAVRLLLAWAKHNGECEYLRCADPGCAEWLALPLWMREIIER